MSQAEEYLSQAMWTVTKMPECSNAIKSKLYRNLGLLHAAKGEYDEALRHLADDVSVCKVLYIKPLNLSLVMNLLIWAAYLSIYFANDWVKQ